MSEKSLTLTQENGTLSQALAPAVSLWADHTTDAGSARRRDLIRDKTNALFDFFSHAGKAPAEITPLDVKSWQAELEAQGLKPATVYAKISRLSSFYNWAIENDQAKVNPVESARPKAPKSYQSESTKSLADEDVLSLLEVVKAKADQGNIVSKRDYAMILFLFFTGRRRREIVNIRWGDVKFNGVTIIQSQVKGGDYIAFEVNHPEAKSALLDYLETAGRLESMTDDTPLWTAHDRSGLYTGHRLTSHALAKNLKKYAKQAGIGDIHLHQTRHTFARWIGEESGSLLEAQDALGHRNLATTKVYLQRVAVKKDKFSGQIGRRLGL